ncbi:hypothetical protein [Sphaerisporangium album]|nr:hypothetical protein [Sphaerisporangium album]
MSAHARPAFRVAVTAASRITGAGRTAPIGSAGSTVAAAAVKGGGQTPWG